MLNNSIKMDLDLKSLIYYYGREKYYQSMHQSSLEGIKKYPSDVSYKLLNGFALVLCRCYQEGIRELENVQNAREVNVGALVALITAHKACQVVDKEAIAQFDEKLKTERKNSQSTSLYYAALFYFLQGKPERARDYLDKFLRHNTDHFEGLCLKGWVDLYDTKTAKTKSAISCFKIALEKDRKAIDPILGMVRAKTLEEDFPEALAFINQSVVKNPKAIPPLIEKIHLYLITKEWDQAFEAAARALALDNSCLEAWKTKTLILICRDGNFEDAVINFHRFINELETSEPKNSVLFLDIAHLFSTISCRNKKILEECYKLADKAAQLDPKNVGCIIELGYQCMRQSRLKEAARFFKTATKLDDSSIDGLTGLIYCQLLMEGVSEAIKQQIEFLVEVQAEQVQSEILLMRSKIAIDARDALQFLHDAAQKKIEQAKKFHFGVKYLNELNVDFMRQVIKENLRWASKASGGFPTSFYKNSIEILKEITDACPGLIELYFELARVHFLVGNTKEAQIALHHILDDLNSSSADAHILMAQIHMQEKSYADAARSLEIALSYNFRVREMPLYHLVSALVLKQNGKTLQVKQSLLNAKNSPAFKNINTRDDDSISELALVDRAMIYIELAQCYLAEGNIDEAEGIMKTAQEELNGTSEEGRLLISKAELSVARDNVNGAIELLRNVSTEQNYFPATKKALAELYLKHKRDKDLYIECYRELVTTAPNTENWSALGDAYMNIREPDLAIEAYEDALKIDPNDSALVSKMGKALVKTHHFSKAIHFYTGVIQKESNGELIYDLAELYFKLGQLDNAERILVNQVTVKKNDLKEISQIIMRTKLLLLLAKVRDKSGSLTDSLTALKTAKENHYTIDKRTITQSEVHKTILSQICMDTALMLTRLRDFTGAIKCFKETLTYKPNDPNVLVGLARLYMQSNNVEECQVTCHHLLSADPNSEPAAVMLADIAFRKVDFDTAAHHLKQLLLRKPDYWTALARFIEVSRRLGRLDDSVVFLDKVSTLYSNSNVEPALSYCVGLFEWLSGNPQSALHNFNRARTDKEWSQQALSNMIEICLNPENEIIGGEAFLRDYDDNELSSTQENALRTAQKLLMELKPQQAGEEYINHRLLHNYWLLASKKKSNIEKALIDFTHVSNDNYYKDNIGAILGISTAYMLQKQSQKARNILKKIAKSDWSYEDAEYLEKCWLLLTDIYIQGNKTDLAADVIQRILQHNKSCYKAYEYAGYIAEKEQLYKEAAFQYENAWKYNGRSNPTVGFKLAYNYLKGKCYVDAIDVCHVVLKLDPNYPKIQKEILEKARNNLRM